ncbi:BMP family ABC transporter substrate-binding protein [soil metagenome]
MTFTTRKALAGLALIGTSALVLAGCAAAPTDEASSGASDYLPCEVSDLGGFDDKSFNQLAYEGLKAAADDAGVEFKAVESTSDADYAPNLQSLVDAGCDLIVTVGFALSAATVESALANPDVNYAIVDDAADNDFNGETDAPNIKPILFDTSQAAFLAGYAASSYTKTGILGTFAGIAFPTVTIFMDGFYQGMTYYNEQKGTDVKLVGYDPATPDTTLATGGFDADDNAKSVAKTVLDQGADVLLPVGGPIFQSGGAAIVESGKDVVLLGADADVFDTFPTYDDLYFTSILKGIKTAVSDVVTSSADGFDATAYVGTLENDGVGIAPFHNYEDKVSADLAGELDTIKASIISGDIKVTSYLNP